MHSRRAAILSALWLAGVALEARDARGHCGDDCTAPLPYILGPTSDVLAPDSVLAYPVPDGRAAMALPFFTLTVTDADGVPVDGSVEVDPLFSLIVWRPAAPWAAGATYTATGRIDTAAWAMAEYGAPPDACTTSDYPVALTIDAMPLPAPAAPPVLVETEHTIVDSDSLDALVCCDGAIPGRSYGPGSCPALELQDAHPCASLRRLGALAVHHTLDRSALSPAASGNLVTRVIGGTPAPRVLGGVRLYAPECVRLEILDVARGVIFVDERCLGDDPRRCAAPAPRRARETREDPVLLIEPVLAALSMPRQRPAPPRRRCPTPSARRATCAHRHRHPRRPGPPPRPTH